MCVVLPAKMLRTLYLGVNHLLCLLKNGKYAQPLCFQIMYQYLFLVELRKYALPSVRHFSRRSDDF